MTPEAAVETVRRLPWLRRILFQGQFTRSVAVLAGGTALGQVLIMLVTPVVTRLYTPADFGVLAVYISVLSIVSVAASLSYEGAIPLPEDDKTAVNVLALSLGLVVGASLLVGLGVWFARESIARLMNTPALTAYLWLLPFSLLGAGANGVFNEWAVRKGAFSRIARTKISQSIGMTVTQLGLGVLKFGPIGLLVGDVIGRVAGTGTLATLAWRQDRALLRRVSLAGVREAAVRYRRFPLFSGPGLLLNTVGVQLPLLLMVSYYEPQIVGWFALANRVLGVPLSLVSAAVAQVYVGESAKMMHTAPERLPKLLIKVVGSMLLIALPYVSVLALIAPQLFPVVFGREWADAGLYVRLMAVMFLLQSIASPTGGTLSVLERQDLHLLREIVRTVLMSGAVVFAGSMGFGPVMSIGLFSIAGSLTYIFYFAMSLYAIRQNQHINSRIEQGGRAA